MAAHIKFIEDGRIFHVTYSGSVAQEEIAHTNDFAEMQFGLALSPIHTLIDLREASSLPDNFFGAAQHAIFNHHRAGMVVVLGNERQMSKLASTVSRIAYFERMCMTDSEEDALDQLRTVMATYIIQ
jgi:hypothetical protein